MEHSEIGFDPCEFSAYFDLSMHLLIYLFIYFYFEPSPHTFCCQLSSQITIVLGIINNAFQIKRTGVEGDGKRGKMF